MSDNTTAASKNREVSVTDARKTLSELIDHVEQDGDYIYLIRHGERVAALMPADIAENYERIEDDYWERRANDARQEIAEGQDTTISWKEFLAGSGT